MKAIEINNLTKDYGNGKGIFDITLSLTHGEVCGYLGPNGAGKTTTMRHLMGFIKPQSGSASICNMNCWSNQKEIQQKIGYLPGEICFPDDMTGIAYLHLISRMRSTRDFSFAKSLINIFEFDPNIKIRKMSKGMKQKLGIVAAFMHNPDILLLDEPTSGLDPLMQSRFIDLIQSEKEKGKTILLSSHIFDEVEKTCDRVVMIRNGRLIRQITVKEMKDAQYKTYKIGFNKESDIATFTLMYPNSEIDKNGKFAIVSITDSELNRLIHTLSQYEIAFFTEEKHTLEEYFMRFYGGDEK